MTVGESIKFHRTKCGLTQKDIAEKLNVSYQTISKWENNTNEPDVYTLKALCEIFGCTVDSLINMKEEDLNEVIEEPEPIESQFVKIQIGICKDCGTPLFSGDVIHHMERRENGIKETVDICDSCFKRHEDLNKQKEAIEHPPLESSLNTKSKKIPVKGSKLLGWSIAVGCCGFIALLVVCIIYFNIFGIGWTLTLPVICFYLLFSEIYCLFANSWISELFVDIASWSVHFPGIIFSFSLDGLKFLIAMKLLFWVLGVLVAIAAILFAILITSICSLFAFPFVFSYNKRGY